jgi:hypothetical protein
MRILLCIAIVLATAAGATAAVVRHHGGPARTGPLELVAKAGKTVTITGPALTGLYPGMAGKPLVVTVRNANRFTIKVAAVTATVAAKTSVAGCIGPANLTVVPGPVTPSRILKGKSARATLLVSMPKTASNACQGARFALTFSAKAVKG